MCGNRRELNRLLSYFGIAKRGGLLSVGVPNVCEALRCGGRLPVFAASDISEATKKKLSDKCAFYGGELVLCGVSGAEISASVGRTGMTAAVYIKNKELSDAALAAANALSDGESEGILPK